MNARIDIGSISKVIRETVKKRLSDVIVNRVSVIEDTDSHGELLLRVYIVLNEEAKAANRARMAGLVRHLRAALEQASSDVFPLVSYVSKRDADRLDLEAA